MNKNYKNLLLSIFGFMLGTEGYAIVSFTITKKGTTENALVVEGKCGDIYGEKADMTDCTDFNASSLKATKKLRYRPAIILNSICE